MLVLVVLVSLTGCSGGTDEPVDPVLTETPGPATVAPEQQFTLDDTAEFDDGLIVEIAGRVADTAADTARGAEATQGQIVVVTVLVENNTPDAYDPTETIVTAAYADGTVAAPVTDSENEIGTGFAGPIATADEGVSVVGFAVPTNQLKRVTIVVDLNDESHEPISFTGEVERPGG